MIMGMYMSVPMTRLTEETIDKTYLYSGLGYPSSPNKYSLLQIETITTDSNHADDHSDYEATKYHDNSSPWKRGCQIWTYVMVYNSEIPCV